MANLPICLSEAARRSRDVCVETCPFEAKLRLVSLAYFLGALRVPRVTAPATVSAPSVLSPSLSSPAPAPAPA
eukprot:CAMPEP_0173188636 /NCGR_PEP_ID=MMETSP1141-20130122/11357_1 /TAXON_ID=483371 /ORGANISM="non described non described, Strain CCMP2298" /LENGTH=72 /DNA_ID=CAMNT_0014112571 /DNA_START=898 /DNA_END=1112 /DNA_ORIENTATION=-